MDNITIEPIRNEKDMREVKDTNDTKNITLEFILNKDITKHSVLKQEYLRKQVIYLSGLPQPVQRSEEWYLFRNDLVTASNWGSILGMNPYQKIDQILLEKCGDVQPFRGNDNMAWGQKYEPVACMIYEYRNQEKVIEFGCIRHPYIDYLGASPDGITEDGIMVEIKCPPKREITGVIPPYYWCQVQGQLEVCDLERCDFLECCIKEYSNKNEYFEDNYNGNTFLNKHGHEKGVIIELFRRSDKSYYFVYSPLGLNEEKTNHWKIDTLKKENEKSAVELSYICYWYLEKVSCIPIYRNQEWFQSVIPQFRDFWDNVIKYRKLGLNVLKEDLKKMKEEVKENKVLTKKIKDSTKEITNSVKKKRKNNTNHSSNNTIHLDEHSIISILPYLEIHSSDKESNMVIEMEEEDEETFYNNINKNNCNSNLFS